MKHIAVMGHWYMKKKAYVSSVAQIIFEYVTCIGTVTI